MWGRGAGALLEAVPVAATAKMRVVAVEYALAPERPFPAAVNDVITIFEQLSATQSPASIGMFGCSAGAMLTAQATARLISQGKPLLRHRSLSLAPLRLRQRTARSACRVR